MRSAILAAAAMSLCCTSAAFAAPTTPSAGTAASKLSIGSNVRASTPGKRSSKAIGPGIGVALGVIGIVAGAVVVSTSDDDEADSN